MKTLNRVWKPVGIVTAICLTVLVLNALVRYGTCAWYGRQTERETRYATFVGCMVKSPAGHWVPRNELRTPSE